MGAGFTRAQFEYDNQLPLDDDSASQALDWIEHGVEQLMMGGDVRFKRRLHSAQAVTFEQFAAAVDECVMEQLTGCGVSPSVLGRLVLAARRKASSEAASAAGEALNSADPEETLREIARALLRPLVADGLVARFEDDEI